MKKFETPEIEVVNMEVEDVITTSPEEPVAPTTSGNGTMIG